MSLLIKRLKAYPNEPIYLVGTWVESRTSFKCRDNVLKCSNNCLDLIRLSSVYISSTSSLRRSLDSESKCGHEEKISTRQEKL